MFRSVRRLLVTANDVPSSPILVTLMKEAIENKVSKRNIAYIIRGGELSSYRVQRLRHQGDKSRGAKNNFSSN
jgi:hypothetical protein